jgi:2-methylcitrate dehydratase
MNIAEELSQYGFSLNYSDMTPLAIERVKQRLLDSLACALGSYGSAPVMNASRFARSVPAESSTIFGGRHRSTPDIAAFVNGTMVRYLDYNDGYMSKEPGHPSDNIPASLAVAEAEGAPGEDLILAIVIAYEIQMRLQDSAGLNKRGWDHVNYVLISSAAASARLMKLTQDQTTQAINMAITGHIALRQVRSGELSSWKGSSAANAARNAIFCARLARYGMEGPSPIFEGKMGFIKQITGELPLDFGAFGNAMNGDYMICRSLTKFLPTNGEMQTAVWAALKLEPWIPDISQIASVHVATTEIGLRILASDPEKWRPSTRETADHSLPYTISRALMDGDVTLKTYSPEMIADATAVPLMDKVKVTEDPALTALFPQSLGNRVTVTLKSGESKSEEVISCPGTLKMPMTNLDFQKKFRRMAEPHISPSRQDDIIEFAETLERQSEYSRLFKAMESPTQAI